MSVFIHRYDSWSLSLWHLIPLSLILMKYLQMTLGNLESYFDSNSRISENIRDFYIPAWYITNACSGLMGICAIYREFKTKLSQHYVPSDLAINEPMLSTNQLENTEADKQNEKIEESKKNKELIIAELKEIQTEQLNQLMNQQKKSENELRETLKKMFQSQFEIIFESLKTDIKSTQTQQFSDLKNQQKQFLQQLQNNAKKKEFMETKFGEIKEDMKQKCIVQNQSIEKQFEGLRKQCKEIQKTIDNQTKQQGILQNLVLDLKSSDVNSNQEAQAKTDNEAEKNHECKLCMDKILTVALKPCGHIVVCENCVEKLGRNCPLCRKLIVGTLKVYLP